MNSNINISIFYEMFLFQVSVNEASAQLCMLLPALLTRRDELFPLARQVVRSSGYQYSKGHSRSQFIGGYPSKLLQSSGSSNGSNGEGSPGNGGIGGNGTNLGNVDEDSRDSSGGGGGGAPPMSKRMKLMLNEAESLRRKVGQTASKYFVNLRGFDSDLD